jgi:hypothetical protein
VGFPAGHACQDRNPFVPVVEMCGGVDKIENFLNTLYVYLSPEMYVVFGGGARQLSDTQGNLDKNLKIYNWLLNIWKNNLAGNIQKTRVSQWRDSKHEFLVFFYL